MSPRKRDRKIESEIDYLKIPDTSKPPSEPGAVAMHEGTYETDFRITISLRDAGNIYLRVYDTHGGYAQVLIGDLGYNFNPPNVPGFLVYIMIVSVIPIIATLLWKIKKKSI